MSVRNTPGPGGFGPSPAFGHGHAGITLNPAQTTPRPGVYSGGEAVTGIHLWWWVALAGAVTLIAAVAVAVRRRAKTYPARNLDTHPPGGTCN